ncbi:uncharacterized protein [Procambarus clarkii]|uniref:uncharacterized protein n=1 Tax=Procambarus clarkii TaxID=6728 RepID=UPI001E670C47|nr:B-box type zinc finger protein ncl-1-like [Procambarus clarkii]XP_045608485.1 B-box type zinc finger protein ncl-1-like [Procambarus clarkii]
MDVLECKVCFESYNSVNRKPRSFRCGHTFCSVCLEDMLVRGSCSCPRCRHDHNALSLNDIPVNYSILSLIDAVESSSVDLSELCAPEAPVRTPKTTAGVCDDHGNHLVFFCTNCDKFICRDCTILDHPKVDHSVITIKNLLSQKKEENKAAVETVKQQSKQEMDDLLKYLDELRVETNMLDKLNEQIKKAMVLSVEEQDRVKQAMTAADQVPLQLSAVTRAMDEASTLDDVNNAATRTRGLKQHFEQMVIDNTTRLMSHENRNNFLKWLMMMISGCEVREGAGGGRAIYLLQEGDGATRSAPITLLHGRLHLHALSSKQPPDDALVLPYGRVRSLVEASSALTFLQLAWGSTITSRIYIRLRSQTQRSHNFLLLCTGERGFTYRGSHFLQAHWLGRCGEYVECGDYELDNGSGGAPLVDALEYDGELKQPIECGVVSARSRATKTASMFKIYTRDSPGYFDKGVFGMVETGMDVMREALTQKDIMNVEVWDCGVVIPF